MNTSKLVGIPIPKYAIKNICALLLLSSSFNVSYSQITTAKVAEKKAFDVVPYDSTQNFLGSEAYNYIGQVLFLKQKPENLQKYGYEGFSKDYTKGTVLNRSNIYKCCDGPNTKYKAVANKYFEVIAVHDHPEAHPTNSYNTIKFLELSEQESGDILYYEYDSEYEYYFPFVVVGYFKKMENKYVGNSYILSNNVLNDKYDIATGEKVDFEIGQEWGCIDFTLDEKQQPCLLVQDMSGQKLLINENIITEENENPRIYSIQEAKGYRDRFGEENWLKILDNKVTIGFTKEMVILAWGKPDKINKASYGDQWVYDNQYLYFENGKLNVFN